MAGTTDAHCAPRVYGSAWGGPHDQLLMAVPNTRSGAYAAGYIVGYLVAFGISFLVALAVVTLIFWLAQKRSHSFLLTARRPWVLLVTAAFSAVVLLLVAVPKGGVSTAGYIAGYVVALALELGISFFVALAVVTLVVWLAQKRSQSFLQNARRPWALFVAVAFGAVIYATYTYFTRHLV